MDANKKGVFDGEKEENWDNLFKFSTPKNDNSSVQLKTNGFFFKHAPACTYVQLCVLYLRITMNDSLCTKPEKCIYSVIRIISNSKVVGSVGVFWVIESEMQIVPGIHLHLYLQPPG